MKHALPRFPHIWIKTVLSMHNKQTQHNQK